MFKKIFSIFVLSFILFGFTDCLEDKEKNESNVYEVVKGRDELSTFSLLLDYIDEEGSQENTLDFSNSLDLPLLQYTVFAPTNEAFNQLDQNDDGVFDDQDIIELETVLGSSSNLANALYLIFSNHILQTSETLEEISAVEFLGTRAFVVDDEDDEENSNFGLSVETDPEFKIVPSYVENSAIIITADLEGDNGFVHVVDKILIDEDSASVLFPMVL
jgi:uncharacterized surface protein with fasciclin (FAS1) repeats